MALQLYPGMYGMLRAQGCAGATISREGCSLKRKGLQGAMDGGAAISRDVLYVAGTGMCRSNDIQGWMLSKKKGGLQGAMDGGAAMVMYPF